MQPPPRLAQTEAAAPYPGGGAGSRLPAVRSARISFDVFSGDGKSSLGRVEHVYASDERGNFGLRIESVDYSADTHGEKSGVDISGMVTPQGPGPVYYQSRGRLMQRLLNRLNEKKLGEGGASTNELQMWRVPDGLLDRQTLMFMFAVSGELKPAGSVLLADHAGNATYQFFVAGSDTLMLGERGEVRATRYVFSSRERPDTIELWIAPGLMNLPLKVRYFSGPGRSGDVIEQVVTAAEFK